MSFRNRTRNEEIVRRRLAGEQPAEIYRAMGISRSVVAGALFRAGLCDPETNKKSSLYAIRGEAHRCAKLTEADVREMRTRFVPRCRENGYKALSREYRVSYTAARKAVQGVTWDHVGVGE